MNARDRRAVARANRYNRSVRAPLLVLVLVSIGGVADAHSHGGGGGHHGGGGGHHGGGGGHHVSVHGRGGFHGVAHGAFVDCDDCGAAAPLTSWWQVSMSMRRFRGPAIASDGTIDYQNQSYAYSLASGPPRAGDTTATTMQLRLLVPTSANLYLGGEFEAGSLTRTSIALSAASSPTVSFGLDPTTVIGGAALAGARVRAGRAELDAELAAGVRAYATRAETFDGSGAAGTAELDTTAAARVDARVRVIAWLTPTWTLGAEVATGVLDRSDVALGIFVGNASAPFAAP